MIIRPADETTYGCQNCRLVFNVATQPPAGYDAKGLPCCSAACLAARAGA